MEECLRKDLSPIERIDHPVLKVEEIRKGFLGIPEFFVLRASGEFFGDREMVEGKDDVAKIKKNHLNGALTHLGNAVLS
jgi:hypothetical protein